MQHNTSPKTFVVLLVWLCCAWLLLSCSFAVSRASPSAQDIEQFLEAHSAAADIYAQLGFPDSLVFIRNADGFVESRALLVLESLPPEQQSITLYFDAKELLLGYSWGDTLWVYPIGSQ